MNPVSLPSGFEMLEPLAAGWALPTQNERQRRRIGASREQLQALYDGVLPQLEPILAHVDRYPLGELPADAARLYHLALSLAEVAPHIELYGGNPKVPHSFDEMRFVAEHGAQS